MKIAVVDDSLEKGQKALEAAKKFGEAEFAFSLEKAKKIVKEADLAVLDFWCGFRKWPGLLRDEIRNKKVIIYSSATTSYSGKIVEFFKKEFEEIGFSGELYISLPNPVELEKVVKSVLENNDEFRIM